MKTGTGQRIMMWGLRLMLAPWEIAVDRGPTARTISWMVIVPWWFVAVIPSVVLILAGWALDRRQAGWSEALWDEAMANDREARRQGR